ncbi:MAG TPA: DUF4440 domain-containing protein [Pyrinomonadaceae bacterium]|nr:DUF4440 domain-containing protein [Pyrinomonadaceae bacterium]
MNLRIVGCSILAFLLGVVLVASITPGVSVVKKAAAMNIQDDRAADREAIRAHIDSIFQAFQVYGNTAVVYSNYAYELEAGGQRFNQTGRVTEVFVLRKGEWVNPGWHMDSGK